MTDDLVRIAEVLEDNASRATNAVQRQIMTSNAAVVRDAKARIEALTAERDEALNQLDSERHSVEVLEKRVAKFMADNARLRGLVQEADDLIGYALPSLQWKRECREFRVKARAALNTGKEVMPVAQFNHTSDIGPGDQAVAGAAPVTTTDMVKDLREKTGAGMVDAKRALTECLGDMDEAIEWLRFKGTSRPYIPKHKRLQAVAAPIRKVDQP